MGDERSGEGATRIVHRKVDDGDGEKGPEEGGKVNSTCNHAGIDG